ncbi:MAG: hypothetical protein R2932_06880 [Caldilineaceae bacterium]
MPPTSALPNCRPVLGQATATGYQTEITQEDIVQALDAGTVVGDDHVQCQLQGYVSPES